MKTRTLGFTLSCLISSLFFSTTPSWAADIQVYFNNPVAAPAVRVDLQQVTIGVINSANSTLDIAIYDLDLVDIANAIVEAKNRGVTVRLITDEDNNNLNLANAPAFAVLDAGGVEWIDDTEDGSAGSGLQHNKFIIVDGTKVLTGSTNFTQSGMLGDLDINGQLVNQGNANNIVVIASTQLASVYTTEFNQMWGDGPGGLNDSLFGLPKIDHELEITYTDVENIRVDVQFSPKSSTQYAGSTLDNMQNYVSAATSRIHIAQFVFSHQDIADRMQEQHSLGAEVKAIGDNSFYGRYYSEMNDIAGVVVLNPSGLPEVDSVTGAPNNAWTNPGESYRDGLMPDDKLHHKYLILDDVVLTGSHNISTAGAFTNDENMVIIHDANVAAQFEGEFVMRFCEGSGQACPNEAPPAPPVCTEIGGTWEGVVFSGEEVCATLDIANNATLTQLDIDIALDVRAANNIITDREIISMDQLELVSYVGASAMGKLKDYIPIWLSL